MACSYCKLDIPVKNLQEHVTICDEYSVDCPNKCGKKLKRKDVADHIDGQNGECKNRPCAFGCKENGDDHARKAAPVHCILLLNMILSLQNLFRTRRDNGNEAGVENLTKRINSIEKQVEDAKKSLQERSQLTVTTCQKEAKRFETHTRSSDVAVAACAGAARTSYQLPEPTIAERPEVTESLSLPALVDKQLVIESLAAVLNREIEQLINHQFELEDRDKVNRDTIVQLTNTISRLEESLVLKDRALKEQQERLVELENTSFDGTLVWPITEFSRRRQEAITGSRPSIYSTPFYTSRAGYKMCARIYLNGDGMGKGTHISLFFVIMKGQYDAILPWPLKQKVTMMLLDQNNREHLIDAFRPDPSSSSFRRPVTPLNIASGVPLFCPLSRLEDRRFAHVKDDTMFIKILVDSTGV